MISNIFYNGLFGVGVGFALSLLWIIIQVIILVKSGDQTAGGAIPLGYVFLILPSCLVGGGVVGSVVGIVKYFL